MTLDWAPSLIPYVAPSIALAWLIGYLVVDHLARGSGSVFFKVFLGFGFGQGIASLTLLGVWSLLGPNRTVLLAVDGAMALGLIAGRMLRRRLRPAPADPALRPPTWTAEDGATAVALVLVLGLALFPFLLHALSSPHGHWDAWAIWNLKARYLVGLGDRWPWVLSDRLPHTHPDYPLLLPGAVASVWAGLRAEPPLAPALIGALFTLSTGGLLGVALAATTRPAVGCLAAAALLATPRFLYEGTAQQADVPLAFFLLAAVLPLTLSGRRAAGLRPAEAGWLAAAGAGLAAWTKNEGLLFLISLTGLTLLTLAAGSCPLSPAARRPFLAVSLAAVFALVAFKLSGTGRNDLLAAQGWEATFLRLTDPGRYVTVGRGLLGELRQIGPGHWGWFPLALPAGLLMIGRRPMRGRISLWGRGVALPAGAVALTFLGYLMAYVVSPYDLGFHIGSSLGRLLVQLWPATIALGCLALAGGSDEAAIDASNSPREPQAG